MLGAEGRGDWWSEGPSDADLEAIMADGEDQVDDLYNDSITGDTEDPEAARQTAINQILAEDPDKPAGPSDESLDSAYTNSLGFMDLAEKDSQIGLPGANPEETIGFGTIEG